MSFLSKTAILSYSYSFQDFCEYSSRKHYLLWTLQTITAESHVVLDSKSPKLIGKLCSQIRTDTINRRLSKTFNSIKLNNTVPFETLLVRYFRYTKKKIQLFFNASTKTGVTPKVEKDGMHSWQIGVTFLSSVHWNIWETPRWCPLDRWDRDMVLCGPS